MGYFDILITIVPLLLVSYLLYFRIKNRGNKRTVKSGTNEYELYQILYSPRFLILSCIIAALSFIDIASRYLVRPSNNAWSIYVVFLLQMFGSVAALFIIYKLYNQYKVDGKRKK